MLCAVVSGAWMASRRPKIEAIIPSPLSERAPYDKPGAPVSGKSDRGPGPRIPDHANGCDSCL